MIFRYDIWLCFSWKHIWLWFISAGSLHFNDMFRIFLYAHFDIDNSVVLSDKVKGWWCYSIYSLKSLKKQVSSNKNGFQRLLVLLSWDAQLFSAESLNLWNQNYLISGIRMESCSSLVYLNTLIYTSKKSRSYWILEKTCCAGFV